MARFLLTTSEDDEGEGIFQALVYPLPSGTIKVVEPTDIRPDYYEGSCSVECCLSKRQRHRLYTNLRTLFEKVDPSVSFLALSPMIYKVDLDKENVLDAIITDEEEEDEENDPSLVWEEDEEDEDGEED